MRIRLRFVIGSMLIVGAIGYLIVTAIRNTSEYYLTVSEVAARQAELDGQSLRVAGRVKAGTIAWDPSSLTLKFAIVPIPEPARDGAVTPVSVTDPASFNVTSVGEPKPDMFAEGRDVIVEGKLLPSGEIAATQVLTSCPSKYQAKKDR
ncbi:MAG TPA: cytochrome c maturation protein CcmE [Candidatus Binataceae bacterium]|nr:cytochrome c maturation protein CcmE [Candidatus Binataceae bacterium]